MILLSLMYLIVWYIGAADQFKHFDWVCTHQRVGVYL